MTKIMSLFTRLCLITVVIVTLHSFFRQETGKANGQSDEPQKSCFVSNDDSNLEDKSCSSEVEAALSLGNEAHFRDALQHILVKRVVGTESHRRVAEYIKSSLTDLGWHIETDKFESYTPRGKFPFENIVAKLNPGASRAVAIACHYDSKYVEEFDFLGATDSAVPCAMMLNLAYTLQRHLQRLKKTDVSLDLIFFDGEEALLEWTDDDSIYGARHLAAKMQQENSLKRMELMVLLDLLGAEYPRFQSHFPNTDNEHRMMLQIEKKLRANNKIRGRSLFFQNRQQNYFQDIPRGYLGRKNQITIQDDHLPFFERGVRVLHVIPTPFPDVWHRRGDNLQALDMPTIEDLNVILRAFIIRYFKL